MGKLRLRHNLDDMELEEALEKALKGIKSYKEVPKQSQNKVANEINASGDEIFDKVLSNMLSEIKSVLEQK